MAEIVPSPIEDAPTFAVGPGAPRAFPEFDPVFSNPSTPLTGQRYRTKEQDALARIALEKELPSFYEAATTALANETILGSTGRALEQLEGGADPNFKWSKQLYDDVTWDVPEEYRVLVRSARSEKHAYMLAKDAKERAERDRRLGLMGWQGAAIQMGAAATDVVALGVGMFVAPSSTLPFATQGFLRARQALRIGLYAGVSNAAIESYIASQDPTRTAEDIIVSGIAGLALGGALGGLIKPKVASGLDDTAAREASSGLGTSAEQMDIALSLHADKWLDQSREITRMADAAAADGRPVTRLDQARNIEANADQLLFAEGRNADTRLGPVSDELALPMPPRSQLGKTLLKDYAEEALPARRAEARNTDSRLGPVTDDVAVVMPGRAQLAVTRLLDYAEDNLPARRAEAKDSNLGPVSDDLAVPMPRDLENTRLLDYEEANLALRREEVNSYSSKDAKEMVTRAEDAIMIIAASNRRNPAITSIQKSMLTARMMMEKIQRAAEGTTPILRARGRLAQAGLIAARMDKGVGTPLLAPVGSLSDIRGMTLRTDTKHPANSDMAPKSAVDLQKLDDLSAEDAASKLADATEAYNARGPALLRGNEPPRTLTEVEIAKKKIGEPKGKYTEEQFMKDLKDSIKLLDGVADDLARAVDIEGAPQALTHVRYAQDRLRGGDGPADSVGAMRVERTPEYEELTELEKRMFDAQNTPYTAFGAVRFSFSGRGKSSHSDTVRKFFLHATQDAVGHKDKSVVPIAASERTMMDIHRTQARFQSDITLPLHQWAEARGVSLSEKLTQNHVDEFMKEVSFAQRRPPVKDLDTLTPGDRAIQVAANQNREIYKDLEAFATAKGIPGFEGVRSSETYVPRVGSARSIDGMVTAKGEPFVVRLVEGAIMRGYNGNIDNSVANRLADAWLKGMRRARFPLDNITRAVEGDDLETLTKLLSETMDTLEAEKLVSKIRLLSKGDPERAKDPNARRRFIMDETFELEGSRLEDLLENNAERLLNRYAHNIFGAGHMQDVLKKFAVVQDGEEVVPSLEKLIREIKDTAGRYGLTDTQAQRITEDMKVVDKLIRGIPLEDKSIANEVMRLLRDYQFMRVGGSFGFAQIPEFGNIIGQGGIRAMVQQMPELDNLFSRAKNGRLNNEFLDEIEAATALGTDRHRRSYSNNLDDYGASENVMFNKVDDVFRRGKAVVADIGLLTTVNTGLQRTSAAVIGQKWLNMAFREGPLTKSELNRFAADSLSPEMLERMFTQMRAHAVTVEGGLGKTVKRMNLAGWADQEAASHFVEALNRVSTRLVQQNDIGQATTWMTKPMARIFTQFRTFSIHAYEKQLLHGIHNFDPETFVSWSSAMMLAGLTYVGQTHVNAIGRSDKKEYLEKRLTYEAIGTSAFQRAGFASLSPSAVDTIAWGVGGDPIFGFSRTSGQPANLLTGAASVGFVTQLGGATGGTFRSIFNSDYDFSQQDARRWEGVGPFSTAMGIRQTYNLLNSTLPETSR